MANIIEQKLEKEIYDNNGLLKETEVTTSSKVIHKSNEEGDYIKIYINYLDKVSRELKPHSYRILLALCKYLSYADIKDIHGGMLIQITKIIRQEIQDMFNIQRRTFYDSLKNLVDCKILKEVSKSCYQVNPNFIGKGYYTYKPVYEQGGIKDVREIWGTGRQQEKIYIDNIGKYTKAMLKSEIEELEKIIKLYEGNSSKAYEIEDALRGIRYWNKQLKKVDEKEYYKNVKYEIEEYKKLTSLMVAQKNFELELARGGRSEEFYLQSFNDEPEQQDNVSEYDDFDYNHEPEQQDNFDMLEIYKNPKYIEYLEEKKEYEKYQEQQNIISEPPYEDDFVLDIYDSPDYIALEKEWQEHDTPEYWEQLKQENDKILKELKEQDNIPELFYDPEEIDLSDIYNSPDYIAYQKELQEQQAVF